MVVVSQEFTPEHVSFVGKPTLEARRDIALELQAGADVGYQLGWGPLFFSAGLGGGVGAAFNSAGGETSIFGGRLLFGNAYNPYARATRFTASLNLNLLKLGVQF